MCLVITVKCAETLPPNVEGDFLDGATLSLIPQHGHYREKRTAAFNISDIQVGGCACGLLTETASWEADTWQFKLGMLPLLEETIVRIAKHSRRGFTFEAAWHGKELPHEQRVTTKELRQIIKENRVSTTTKYRVAA